MTFNASASTPGRNRLNENPCCYWLTGLSGAGKSTLAAQAYALLKTFGHATYVLDDDAVRQGLCRRLSYTRVDRQESVRRIAEVARLMVDAGLVVFVTTISPYREDRDAARSLFLADTFFEVFVDAPLTVCAMRDPKHLYARALRGEIRDFAGISEVYERPLKPDLHLETTRQSAVACAMTLHRHYYASVCRKF